VLLKSSETGRPCRRGSCLHPRLARQRAGQPSLALDRGAAARACDTALRAGAAISGCRQIYKPGHRVPKAGLMLMDLQTSPNAQPEQDLDVPRARLRKPDGRAQCLDHALRARFDPARQRQRRRGWVRPGLDDEAGAEDARPYDAVEGSAARAGLRITSTFPASRTMDSSWRIRADKAACRRAAAR